MSETTIIQADRDAARNLADYAGFKFAADHLDMALDATAEAFARHRQSSTDDLVEALKWIEAFAQIRSEDDSKTFARVNRGALRTIAEKCGTALNKAGAL